MDWMVMVKIYIVENMWKTTYRYVLFFGGGMASWEESMLMIQQGCIMFCSSRFATVDSHHY